MNIYLTVVAAILLTAILMYLLGSFVAVNFNIKKWPAEGRAIIAFLFAVLLIDIIVRVLSS